MPLRYVCVDGACEPGTVPKDPAVPDVTGVWYTKHVFAIRDSLPPGFREAFAAIRALDSSSPDGWDCRRGCSR